MRTSDATHTVLPRRLLTGVVAAVLGVSASIVACYNEVPGPQGPLPSPIREVPPQGPAPQPIVPAPSVAPKLDGGIPVIGPQSGSPPAPSSASSSPGPSGAARAARLTIPLAPPTPSSPASENPASDPPPPTQPPQQQPPKQAPPVDAGIDSTADLPRELPDAAPTVAADAGQPLHQ